MRSWSERFARLLPGLERQTPIAFGFAAAASVSLAACSTASAITGGWDSRATHTDNCHSIVRVPLGKAVRKLGRPYEILGQRYVPRVDETYDKIGIASWYGAKFHGRRTSNGEIFDMRMMTAAHPTLPLPSFVRVQNLVSGQSIVVRVNDRGPFIDNRIIDLSAAAADCLNLRRAGLGRVRVTFLGHAEIR